MKVKGTESNRGVDDLKKRDRIEHLKQHILNETPSVEPLQQNTCIPYLARFSGSPMELLFQGRFILLDHPYKVNLDVRLFSIGGWTERTTQCGFEACRVFGATISPCGLSFDRAIVRTFPQNHGPCGLLSNPMGKTDIHLGKTSAKLVDKLKNTWGMNTEEPRISDLM